jgi:dihydroorotase
MPAPVFFTNARLIDPATGYDGPGALKASGGSIDEIVKGASPTPGDGTVIDCGGLPLAPGIVDMRVFVGEPGARHRESFRSAGEAAAAGGITTFVAQPETDPPLDDPALVQFALARAREVSPVRVMRALCAPAWPMPARSTRWSCIIRRSRC